MAGFIELKKSCCNFQISIGYLDKKVRKDRTDNIKQLLAIARLTESWHSLLE